VATITVTITSVRAWAAPGSGKGKGKGRPGPPPPPHRRRHRRLRHHRRRLHRLLATEPAPVAATSSQGPAFYVATTGSDSNPGTINQPWQTVQKALDTLQAGGIAYVRGGTYEQDLLWRLGTATAPFTIRNFPGERVVLGPGAGGGDNEPLQIGNGAGFVRFQGLVFEGATGSSTANVYAWGRARHRVVCVRDHWFGAPGFFSEASTSSIQIIGCNIHDNGGGGRRISITTCTCRGTGM
jgi:hypothetical protein